MLQRRYVVGGFAVLATVVLVLAAVFVSTAGAVPHSAAQPSSGHTPEATTSVHHDVYPALRDLPAQATAFRGSPDRPLRSPALSAGPDQPDGALQSTASTPLAATTVLSFGGLGRGAGDPANFCACAPPDTNGAVGATQYVQIVNTGFGVFNKTTGAMAAGFPKANNTLWAGFGGGCETHDDGDPAAQSDQAAGRWILTQFSVSTPPFLQCVAVPTSSDATGTYNRYSFNYGNVQFPDYPKLGVWPDAYYITYNIFNNGATFAGP